MNQSITYFLFDNGSLRPESFQQLRHIARQLSEAAGETVKAVSLLHSNKVDPALLGGEPAQLLEAALREELEAGSSQFICIPLFFGPSRALTDYLPRRITLLKERYPRLSVCVAAPLVSIKQEDVSGQDSRVGPYSVAEVLADQVEKKMKEKQLSRPAVILVDHGTPAPAVNAVRNQLAAQLKALLGEKISCLQAASMESRPGEAYAFNQPLLEDAFAMEGFGSGDVVVSLLFLSPGRHAGEGGDIASICANAEREHNRLRTHRTALVGEHPGLITILRQRLIHARQTLLCSAEAR